MGLGLAIARDLVELMGGRLELEDRPGGGSIFRFRLALSEVGEPTGPTGLESRSYRSGRILLVEDNRINRRVVTRMLERAGHQVSARETAEEALELLACRWTPEPWPRSCSACWAVPADFAPSPELIWHNAPPALLIYNGPK